MTFRVAAYAFVSVLFLRQVLSMSTQDNSASKDSANLLFCAYGASGNLQRNEEHRQLAVAVVEINSETMRKGLTVSGFDFIETGESEPTKLDLILPVEQFDAPRHDAIRGKMGYYRFDPRSQIWNGMLQGKVRLRVRGWLPSDRLHLGLGTCRIKVGPYVINGPLDGTWFN